MVYGYLLERQLSEKKAPKKDRMLYFSLFLAGFTLGIFTSLKVFSPDKHEDIWDPQQFPIKKRENHIPIINYKGAHIQKNKQIIPLEKPLIHLKQV